MRYYGQNKMYFNYKRTVRPNKVSQKKFTEICKDFNGEIMRAVLEDGFSFFVPYGQGVIKIVRTNKVNFALKEAADGSLQQRKRTVDWPTSKRVGKRIYYENDHTNGYQYKICWFKGRDGFRYQSVYKFTACKKARQKLYKILTNPDRTIDYASDITSSTAYKQSPINIRFRNGI